MVGIVGPDHNPYTVSHDQLGHLCVKPEREMPIGHVCRELDFRQSVIIRGRGQRRRQFQYVNLQQTSATGDVIGKKTVNYLLSAK